MIDNAQNFTHMKAKTIKISHLKTSNSDYPRGGESPFTSACQKNAEIGTRERFKLIKKSDFVDLVEKGKTEHLCPKCIESLKPKEIDTNFIPKTAFYSMPLSRGTMYGQVTSKPDGKVSVSINNSSFYCAADRYKFKNLGEQIVKANFNHPAIYKLLERNFKGLIEKLREATTELKTLYIERTIVWAEERYIKALKDSKKTDKQWLDEWEIEYNIVEQYGKKYYKIKQETSSFKEQEMQRAKSEAKYIVSFTQEKYIDDCRKKAERHYEGSLIKLCDRLHTKGIKDDSEFEITYGRIGVNFEITIAHHDVITYARTIIAEGPVQCPHYRYLVS